MFWPGLPARLRFKWQHVPSFLICQVSGSNSHMSKYSHDTISFSDMLRSLALTDINAFTECYATMAAILSAAFPQKAPQFFAYLWVITKVNQKVLCGPHTTIGRQPAVDPWIGPALTQPYILRPSLGGPSPSQGADIF